jgi:hypothetical protein
MQVNPMSDMRGDARGTMVGARIYGPVELALVLAELFSCLS